MTTAPSAKTQEILKVNNVTRKPIIDEAELQRFLESKDALKALCEYLKGLNKQSQATETERLREAHGNYMLELLDATDEIRAIAKTLHMDAEEQTSVRTAQPEKEIHLNYMDASAPLVIVNFNGCPVRVLCDTGASVTSMSKALYDTIDAEVRPPIVPAPHVIIKAANSQIVELNGIAQFEIQLGDYRRKTGVYISPSIPEPGCLLGRDFLHAAPYAIATDRLVDLKLLDKLAGTDVLNQCSTRYEIKSKKAGTVIPLRVLNTTKILPGERKAITVKLDRLTDQAYGIFDGLISDEEKGLSVPTVLHDLRVETLHLHVLNSSTEIHKIFRDSIIGTCDTEIDLHGKPDEMTEEQFINAVQRVFVSPSPDDIENAIRQCKLEECDALDDKADVIKLEQLLRKHIKAISTSDMDMGYCELERFRINTIPGAVPPKVTPTKIPLHWQADVKAIIDNWEKLGIIEPSDSPFTARILVVPKKDGSKRVCVDYRKLNAITVPDPFPLPNPEMLRESLYKAKFFIALDLNLGFMQMALDPETAHKTAFVLQNGHYQFTVMPFGPMNSPSVFTKLMTRILAGLLGLVCLCYIDDILIFGETVSETLERLEIVLVRLIEHNMKLKPKKCLFFRKRVDYLGHEISADGVEPMKGKIEKILNWPRPQNPRALRGFLGLAGYYRGFIKEFGGIAQPLYQIAKIKDNSSKDFVWTAKEQLSFETLKDRLTHAPVLAFPNATGLFVLDTDASDFGLGGVLQQYQDGQLRVIAYGSKTISGSWKNYSVTQKEMLAIVYFVRAYRHYLLGRRFVLRTDHAALQWLFSFKDPTGMIARWITSLSAYDMAIVYRKGKENGNADALSRMPEPTLENAYAVLNAGTLVVKKTSEQNEEAFTLQVTTAEPVGHHPTDGKEDYNLLSIDWPTDPMYDWELQQTQDIVCVAFTRTLTSGETVKLEDYSQQQNFELSRMLSKIDKFVSVDGLLYYCETPEERSLVVPYKVRRCLVEDIHRTAHKGRKATIDLVKEKFWWPTMAQDVTRIVQTCEICQQCKRLAGSKKAPLQHFPCFQPFTTVALDLVGPLNTIRGKSYILTIIDFATRWIEAIPLANSKAPTVARAFFNEWCCRYGHPTHVHSDQGKQFDGSLFHELCRIMCTKKTRTTAYHPQCNGRCEKANGSLIENITTLVKEFPNDWDRALPFALAAIRKSINATTGFSPAQLVFGRNLPTSFLVSDPPPQIAMKSVCEWIDKLDESLVKLNTDAERNVLHKQALYKKHFDKHTRERNFQVGDLVNIIYHVPPKGTPDHYKFYPRYHGPYVIVEKLSDVVFRVKARSDPEDVRKLNIADLKLFLEPDPRTEEECTPPEAEIPARNLNSSRAAQRILHSNGKSISPDMDYEAGEDGQLEPALAAFFLEQADYLN